MWHGPLDASFSLLRWLNQNASAVQAIVAIVIAVLTGILIWVTYRYTKAQHRVSLTMERDLLFRSQPLLNAHLEDTRQGHDKKLWYGKVQIMNDSNAPCRLVEVILSRESIDRTPPVPKGLIIGAHKNYSFHFNVQHVGQPVEFTLIYQDMICMRQWKYIAKANGNLMSRSEKEINKA